MDDKSKPQTLAVEGSALKQFASIEQIPARASSEQRCESSSWELVLVEEQAAAHWESTDRFRVSFDGWAEGRSQEEVEIRVHAAMKVRTVRREEQRRLARARIGVNDLSRGCASSSAR